MKQFFLSLSIIYVRGLIVKIASPYKLTTMYMWASISLSLSLFPYFLPLDSSHFLLLRSLARSSIFSFLFVLSSSRTRHIKQHHIITELCSRTSTKPNIKKNNVFYFYHYRQVITNISSINFCFVFL